MNFLKLFSLLFVIACMTIGTEAAPKWKGWKKIVSYFVNSYQISKKYRTHVFSVTLKQEKAGKNVFHAAEKVIPVVAGAKAIG